MAKIILTFIVGAVAGIGSTCFYFNEAIEEAFFEGSLSESAAMSKLIAELATNTDKELMKEKLLTLGCISASATLEQINAYNVSFPGHHLVVNDAQTAYDIAKEEGIKNCEK